MDDSERIGWLLFRRQILTDAISQPRPDQRLAVARRRFDQQVRA